MKTKLSALLDQFVEVKIPVELKVSIQSTDKLLISNTGSSVYACRNVYVIYIILFSPFIFRRPIKLIGIVLLYSFDC